MLKQIQKLAEDKAAALLLIFSNPMKQKRTATLTRLCPCLSNTITSTDAFTIWPLLRSLYQTAHKLICSDSILELVFYLKPCTRFLVIDKSSLEIF